MGYDPDSQVLAIGLHDGGAYRYDEVPEAIFDGFMIAPSKGNYFPFFVRSVFPYHQV